jgi:DNA mismatch repair protein MutS
MAVERCGGRAVTSASFALMHQPQAPHFAEPADQAAAAGRVTPMMEQYIEIKAANPDCLLFYRMGDFYELFFGDAEVASRALGIALTKRGKHLGQDIPMCGVPIHAADEYLQRLISLGHRVAVCEQTEDPAEARKRGSKAVVRREVVRLVTPGTLTEESLLESGRNNFLAAIVRRPASHGEADGHAVAWIDISTGEFRVAEAGPGELASLIARIEPREAIAAERAGDDAELRAAVEGVGAALALLPASFFDSTTAEGRLTAAFGVQTMAGFGAFSRAELAAAAAILAYVDKTQIARRPPIEPPRRQVRGETMQIDAATRANLELFRRLSGERAGSLLAAVDATVTAAGSRLLAQRLAAPLRDAAAIGRRLDAVEAFLADAALRGDLRARLAEAPDMVRALSRLALDRGSPRDFGAIRAGLKAAKAIAERLARSEELADEVEACRAALSALPPELLADLSAALAEELPVAKRDGGFVRPGYEPELDEARRLRDESRRVIAHLQARYAEETGVRSLKIRHNNLLGFFVEVSAANAATLTDGRHAGTFIHRQTMAGAMRFTSAELAELESRIASAGERALAIELDIFDALSRRICDAAEGLRAAAAALAALDVAAALAERAASDGHVRPRVDDSLAFAVKGGRHPVVEAALRPTGQAFVANDCDLGPADSAENGRIWLLTGPNMAGKSTFLRQNALIAILAQAGSYVPAKSAHIGIVDAVFSRVGAADDLARGRSTFMVEMVETAAILNQAGPRALVILDEIGRGTATFDGLSIAWATIEHLHDVNRCRALFATHYHELTALAAKLPRLHNATMQVKEWKGDVIFLHEVVPGAADRSYGVQVAKLAGLPAAVTARARRVLDQLEAGERGRDRRAIVDDLPLFSAVRPAPEPERHPALEALEALAPDDLSPREALEALYALKRLLRDGER